MELRGLLERNGLPVPNRVAKTEGDSLLEGLPYGQALHIDRGLVAQQEDFHAEQDALGRGLAEQQLVTGVKFKEVKRFGR